MQSEARQLSTDVAEHRDSLSTAHASTGGAASAKTESGAESVAKSSETRESRSGEKKTMCSTETHYGVYNFKMTVSREMLQRGAAVLSQHMSDIPYTPDVEEIQCEGPLRRMAVSITE